MLLILSTIVFSCGTKTKDDSKEINVLFIGNSLTYYNDMPQKLQEMLNENKTNIKIDQITYPGFSLNRHLNNIITSTSENGVNTRVKEDGEITETEKKLKEKKWDIIILQTGGVAVLIPESVKYQVNPTIKKIKELVNDNETRFILFNTWPSKVDFPKKYCYSGRLINSSLDPDENFCSTVITNSEHYLQLLNKSYKSIADHNSLELTNHGDLFQRTEIKHPELEVLEDDMHPSDIGAFLSASIFYELITNKNVIDLSYVGELNKKDADKLKKLVK